MTTEQIWNDIIAKPKWYSGIKSGVGKFYTAQDAYLLKRNFKRGVLSESTIERIFKAHGYVLIKKWVVDDQFH